MKFVIHEHRASHHHFDLRLQIHSVLKSWAVPKGPSMNPKDKRLAIMVDDHDLEYLNFEGIIPEGQYGAGIVTIWDNGDYELIRGDIESGMIEFFLKGSKLKGLFMLIKMKGKKKEWLLIKKKDEFVDAGLHSNKGRKGT